MNRGLESRLTKLEGGADGGRPHIVWADGMTADDMDAATERLLAAGTIRTADGVIFVRWKNTESLADG